MGAMVVNRQVIGTIVFMAVVPTILATTMWNISVGAVGPNDGSTNGVQLDLREVGRIPKRLEDRPLKQWDQINNFRTAVVKRQSKGVGPANLNFGYAKNHAAAQSIGEIWSKGSPARAILVVHGSITGQTAAS